jgi:DNA-binding transcriptional LysR family regulator
VGVIGRAARSPELSAQAYALDELVVIVAPSHPFAETSSVRAADVASQPLILRERGSATRRTVEDGFRVLGLELKPTMQLGGTTAVKRAVAAGLGIGIVSRFSVEPEAGLRQIVTLSVSDVALQRQFHVVYRRDKWLSPAATALLELLRLPVSGGAV